MMVIRPIRESDQEAFEKFASTAGTGVTSLPRNSTILKQRVRRSIASFASQSSEVEGLYIFVLEDIETGELGGTCAIDAKTLGSEDGYFLRVEEIVPPRTSFPSPKTIRILQPIQRKTFASEVGGLYLLPKYRNGGIGRLLSLSRFLFIAAFTERFHSTIIAEMRGRIDKDSYSPFWESLGRHFINLPYARMLAEIANDHSLIPKVMPQFPIYVSMLSPEAQRTIGKTHKNTRAAMGMLTDEGFQYTGEIDILDAGPKLAAQTAQISSIANSTKSSIGKIIEEPIEGIKAIVSNELLLFRATIGTLAIHPQDNSITLHRDTAAILQVKPGDSVRYIVRHPKPKEM